MKVSLYSQGWNLNRYHFDYRGALDNWALHADEIVIAINTSTDGTLESVSDYATAKGYPVKIVPTTIDFQSDPFAYGKVVDSALQACTGDIMIQQDMDERIRISRSFLAFAHGEMIARGAKALFIPTIDLYGDINQYCHVGQKWYVHLPGLKRGAVDFGIKENGRPDYNKTSSDELLTPDGKLVPTIHAWSGNESDLSWHVRAGYPIVYHLGYLSLTDRADRAVWWKDFWERATGGDKNGHVTSVEELLKRATKPHDLPLWETHP